MSETDDKTYNDAGEDWREPFELQQVRKIACALIQAGEQRYPIPETAWEIWRAIKAGQEDRKP